MRIVKKSVLEFNEDKCFGEMDKKSESVTFSSDWMIVRSFL